MIHLMPDWLLIALEFASMIGGILGAVGGIAAWLTRNALVTQADMNMRFAEHEARHKVLEERLSIGSQRFAVIENELKHMPKAEDIQAMSHRIGAVERTLDTLGAQLQGLRDILERIEHPLSVIVDWKLKGGR